MVFRPEARYDNQKYVAQDSEWLKYLRKSLTLGQHWTEALLQTIGLWTLPQEVFQGREYKYLIMGEALDWLVLAERLSHDIAGYITEMELEDLLFMGVMPNTVTQEVFRSLIGPTKYRAHLNYWYGVIVEEALQLATEEDVRKRHRSLCYPDNEDLVEEAFKLLYNKSRHELLQEFTICHDIAGAQDDILELTLSDYKAFTYSLFKMRMKMWDPARLASDTKKGIGRLEELQHVIVDTGTLEYIDSLSLTSVSDSYKTSN